MSPPPKKWTRWLISAAKCLVFAVLCWFIYHTLASANQSLDQRPLHVEPQWIVLAGLLYLLGTLPSAIFWQRVLVRTGQDVKLGEAIRAYYISQLGKYVPGKWMVILLRNAMLQSAKIENTTVAASIFYETFTTLAVGSAVSAIVLIVWQQDQRLLIAMAVGSMVLMGLPTVPTIFQWLIRVLRVGKLNPTTGARFGRIGIRAIVIGWITISIGCLVQGMSLWATLRGMGATEAGPFYELSLHTASIALGLVAGFISQIPGGLGMREWVSAELIKPEYGETVAVVSAVIFRLVMLVSELLISIILYSAGWRRLRKPVAAVEAELTASGNR